MTEPSFRQKIADYILSNAKPVDKWSHQPRLYALACRLAETRPFDDDVLYAAAWLHDIGVFIGHRPEDPAALAKWDNLVYALEKVPALLKEFGFPPEKISPVIEVIRTHLPSGEPTTFEGELLRDADILEQLGAIGILRNVSKVGRDTRFFRFGDTIKLLQRNVTQLPAQLRLASARRMAEQRVKVLQTFLDAAHEESCGVEL
ncbi:MAG: metal dependent phosphohydrolase [Verrucomicrobiales bacterium]|nr:metal dependent phosphohydrolase [Verrucomicrobiales bacterium]